MEYHLSLKTKVIRSIQNTSAIWASKVAFSTVGSSSSKIWETSAFPVCNSIKKKTHNKSTSRALIRFSLEMFCCEYTHKSATLQLPDMNGFREILRIWPPFWSYWPRCHVSSEHALLLGLLFTERKKEIKEPVFSQLSTPFRSSDISDPGVQMVGTGQRDACEQKKLPSRSTPLSQRLEQARLEHL